MIASKPYINLKNSRLTDPERSSESALMKDIFYKILHLAKQNSNVIIVGEIGSGKERLAHIIHENSPRADQPFYAFYCVDVSESEYKEAFWGHLQFEEDRVTLRYNALEEASGGILYLNQFSELSPQYMNNIVDSYQKGCKQLFRYNREAKPRLLMSLNQESYQDLLQTPVWEKLLGQLDPVVIMLPPLRERREDIPILINYFLKEIREKNSDYKDLKISAQALYECFHYDWPGNIRQLKNAMLQGAILSYGQTIELRHLPFTMSWKLPYELDESKT